VSPRLRVKTQPSPHKLHNKAQFRMPDAPIPIGFVSQLPNSPRPCTNRHNADQSHTLCVLLSRLRTSASKLSPLLRKLHNKAQFRRTAPQSPIGFVPQLPNSPRPRTILHNADQSHTLCVFLSPLRRLRLKTQPPHCTKFTTMHNSAQRHPIPPLASFRQPADSPQPCTIVHNAPSEPSPSWRRLPLCPRLPKIKKERCSPAHAKIGGAPL